MDWLYVVTAVILAVLLIPIALYALGRYLEKREPYGAFLKLRTRAKLRFFRLLLADDRVPMRVKAVPLLLIPYLLFPIDLIPDFIPVLGYVDDVALVLGALALALRLTPRPVIDDLLGQLSTADSA